MNRPPARRGGKPLGWRWTYGILIATLLFVLMPFLFWHATWFGRPLTDTQIEKALSEAGHPREIQHALAQIESRMRAGDPAARRWYPQVAGLSRSPVPEIRLTAAWVMGQDNTSSDFHEALRHLLSDPQPMVVRNAALSLVRFADPSGHDAIASMLRPFTITSPSAGMLRRRLKPGDTLNTGTLLAHIEVGARSREVRSAVPGTLECWLAPEGSSVSAGRPIASLAPSQEMVWEALRALYLIGTPADLGDVSRYAGSVPGMPLQIQRQASMTQQAIRSRARS